MQLSQADAAARDADAETLSSALAEQQAKLTALEEREASLKDELTALVRFPCAYTGHVGLSHHPCRLVSFQRDILLTSAAGAQEAENLEIRSLLIEHQELSELAGEMGARYASQISELCRQLGDKDAEVREARLEGTPRGEGAKVLRDMLLERLRQREAQLEVAEAALADAAARVEEAESRSAADRSKAAEAEGVAARLALELASELHAVVQELSETRMAAAEAEASAGVEGDLLRQHIADLEVRLAAEVSARGAAENEMRMMGEESAAMVNDLVEASAEAAKLRAKLERREDELLRAKVRLGLIYLRIQCHHAVRTFSVNFKAAQGQSHPVNGLLATTLNITCPYFMFAFLLWTPLSAAPHCL